MGKQYTPKELDALEGCTSNKIYVAKHEKLFPEFYKDSVLSGIKRASTIWWKRDKLLAKLNSKREAEKQKAHLIEIKQLKRTEHAALKPKQEVLPDDGEILIKILQELRIHTKQYDDLLAIARAPKGTMPMSSMPYISTNPFAPTKTFTAGDAIADKH
jgi:hypothetical protein